MKFEIHCSIFIIQYIVAEIRYTRDFCYFTLPAVRVVGNEKLLVSVCINAQLERF